MPTDCIVIGSGPAGVACARALTARGHAVTLVDAGVELEPERRLAAGRLARTAVEDWTPAERAVFCGSPRPGFGGVPLKLSCGSDFPYQDVARLTPIDARGVTAFASLALGGLSNVWGAAVLPFRASDIADWPIPAEALDPGYRAVFGYLPLAARRDDLEAEFPLHCGAPEPLNPSERAARMLEGMAAARAPLRAAGISFGASRLAVANPASGGCRHCGLCLHGCPWNLIYNAAQSLGTIRRRAGLVVDRVEETGARIRLRTRALADGAAETLECDRVFLACGTYQTARIMLNSQPSLGALTLRDSQYFLLPLLGAGAAGAPEAERLHTLAQIFLEVADERISRYPAHLQIYTYNDLYPRAIRDKLRAFPWLAARIARAVSRRLLAIQGYLHSHESGTATMRMRGGTLEIVRVPDARPARIVRALVRKLSRHADALGCRPLAPLLNIGRPGQGAHAGATFPMRAAPGEGESDTLGRPAGFRRVHLVDASVLPSIPSTTITLTIMANAHRIGSAAHDG